jgi:predicted Zn-dependent protease
VDRPVLEAMKQELGRTVTELKLPDAAPPYYASYWVLDAVEHTVETSLGAVVSDTLNAGRFARVELRVGSREYDNSNSDLVAEIGGVSFSDSDVLSPQRVPKDEDPLSLRRALWLITDIAYKHGVEKLERKRADKQTAIAARSEVPSFSLDRSAVYVSESAPPAVATRRNAASAIAARVSSAFRAFPEVQRGDVRVRETTVRRRFVSSDGGLVVEPSHLGVMEIAISGQAADGMQLRRFSFLPAKKEGTFDESAARSEATRIARELAALVKAPVAEDYVGPVLFEGRAAAQLAFELMGASLSGTPPPEGSENFESPLARRLGNRVLPKDFSVVDDPTLESYEGVRLLGGYHVDDEGIVATKTSLVEDGLLRTFLMSRAPREGVPSSNGHGRSGLVGWAHGVPSNLVVTAKKGLSKHALRKELLAAVREEGEKYGLVVTEFDPSTSPSSGGVIPPVQVAYKVSLDGTETLVRGAELATMNVRSLRDILAAGREKAVYGFVSETRGGLDMGTSIVAPALLFENVEVHGPTAPNKRPPVVPRPAIEPMR